MLQGDDCSYTASTEGSAFDAVLAVYFTSTGCESMYCAAENGYYSGSSSSLSWSTISGLDYYILVAGYAGDTGEYGLTVTVRQGNFLFWF